MSQEQVEFGEPVMVNASSLLLGEAHDYQKIRIAESADGEMFQVEEFCGNECTDINVVTRQQIEDADFSRVYWRLVRDGVVRLALERRKVAEELGSYGSREWER